MCNSGYLQGGKEDMSMVISASSMMRRAYSGNAYFKDEGYRKSSSNHDIVSADRKAMVRALEQLEGLDFESDDEDAAKSICNTITSYLDIYNNAVSSALGSNSSDIRRIGKHMKELMKEHSSSLEAMGVQVKSDGTVKVDKSTLQKATSTQVSGVFGNSDYISGMSKLMKRLRNQVNREAPVQTGTSAEPESDSLLTETVGRNLNLYG